jgi:DNA-directed RNA polymerase beta' subunit
MNQDTREIEKVAFGVYSHDEILNMSACKVSSNKREGSGTVYDLRMGTTDSQNTCETCKEGAQVCPGHQGHIEFNEPIIHPLYYKQVVSFLRCFCTKCYKLLIVKDQIALSGLSRYNGNSRFTKIIEKLEKVDICCQPGCGNNQPDIKYGQADGSISMVYVERDKNKTSIVLTVVEIKKIFDNVTDSDIKLLGFDPKLVNPSNFIITVLPVLPPCDRPYVKADGHKCDDDLSNQYIEIIKVNNNLENPETETKRQKDIQSLKFRVLTMFDNRKGKAKHTTNGRPIKGIKERITGKEGQIRNNLMGKRVNQSGRSVIGPDPTLKMGQIALPFEMAKILTIPVRVAVYNLDSLTKIVNDGKANFVIKWATQAHINLKRALFGRGTKLMSGDIIHRGTIKIPIHTGKEKLVHGDMVWRCDAFLKDLKIPCKRTFRLHTGDIVERQLRDGDFVLLNRQPTLHKASMMVVIVILKKYKTIRMNLAITKPYNADFDGDEMNIHVPQTLESQAELRLLSAVKWNMISAQDSKPNICIVQDSLLGAYQMTKGIKKLKKGAFFNIVMKLEKYETCSIMDRINHIQMILKEKGKKPHCFTGMGLVSLILPLDFNYEKKNNGNPDEPAVKIYRGVMYEGTLNKAVLGSTHNSIIQVIHKEYGETEAAEFVDSIQFVTNEYLLISGFSVGIKDCLVSQEVNEYGVSKKQEIKDVVQKCFIEAEGVKATTSHPGIMELRVNAALGKAKDIGLRIAKDALAKDNNFLSTVNSGSKGDFFNIAQITGLLGQQNLRGQRVKPVLNNGRRTLPHYPFKNTTVEMEYESRGFIESSFINGLNPREFYFHAMSGREGISDTAMGTATSGYMQRRIIKLTEDIKVQYDGTVRDTTGIIYQISYGESGFDPSKTVKVDGLQESCNIDRLISRLNMKHELSMVK